MSTVKFIHVKTNEPLFVFADQVSCVMTMPGGYTTLVVPGSAIPVTASVEDAIQLISEKRKELIVASAIERSTLSTEVPTNGIRKRTRSKNKRNA